MVVAEGNLPGDGPGPLDAGEEKAVVGEALADSPRRPSGESAAGQVGEAAAGVAGGLAGEVASRIVAAGDGGTAGQTQGDQATVTTAYR